MHVLNGREGECFVILEVTTSQHNKFISLHIFLFVNFNQIYRRLEMTANINTNKARY
jgi:hypothetical protein